MNYKEIENLIKVLSDSKLTYLEIQSDGLSIKMGKGERAISKEQDIENKEGQSTIIRNTIEQIQTEEESIDIQGSAYEETAQGQDGDFYIVKSPIVGTFYASPSQQEPLFVKVGEKITKGKTLCIIEAMKLMNEINSEVDGEIVEILVNNEDMVEYGQPLYKIKI